MADISTELARILSAIYGEDVRGSIHDAIEKINDVSEVVLTTGTDVTGPSSSSTGFYDGSLYLNTDTFELWKCTGVNTWASQGILKGDSGADGADGNGIASITKTATSGLVDTYTITYTDGNADTFTVTNGKDGANGNKWYRGTGISGKAALPTVYTGSGVADANSGDMFLNPSEGAVYSCVTGGIPTVATWQYEMTLSGGGGGTSDYPDLTNKPQINGHILLGNQTGADLGLANSSDIPTVDQTYSATSSNAQSGKAVASAISGKADTSLLKSTVGWTGKNLLKNTASSRIVNGVTVTVNLDGSVTLNGTHTASSSDFQIRTHVEDIIANGMILSGVPSDASNVKLRISLNQSPWTDYAVDTGSGATISGYSSQTNVNCNLTLVGNGTVYNDVTLYPMLRDASITDDTYEPYHESVETMYEEEMHGVNLLKNEGTTQTINGITFTVNADGSVTVNGTATANTFLIISPNTATNKYENNIISGCPAGGNLSNSYCLTARVGLQSDDSYVKSADDTGNGAVIPKVNTSTEWIRFYIRIANGYTANNLVFKPMLRKADIEDSTYRPYNYQAIQNQLNAQGVLGAKNLLNHKRSGSTTIQGITYTVNADLSISTSGTADANNNSWWNLLPNGITLPAGKYIISDNGNLNTSSHSLAIRLTDNTYVALGTSSETEVTLTDTKQIVEFSIGIAKGQASNNYVFKPMIRLASDPDDTYVPYAMTNKEITEELTAINNGLDDWTSPATVSSSGTVSFSGLNDSYGYKIYYTLPSGDSAYTFSKVTKSGSGTSVTLTYTTDAPSGTVCKLRILK